MPEVGVLKYTHDPKAVMVCGAWQCVDTDLSVLTGFTNLRDLVLRRLFVESWEFAKQLPLKKLVLDVCEFPSLVQKWFPSLEELCVNLRDATDFVLLERLANLKTITFGGETRPSLEALRTLSTSFPDLNVVASRRRRWLAT
jgi:hypothetical protein